MTAPLFLKPYFQEKMWGGKRLKTEFGYEIPSDTTGECWAISAHPHGPAVIENGPYQGLNLAELWQQHREVFGNAEGKVFPLLTKILDARDDLSVQVHPDDAYALKHEGELGKTECWYVLAADEGAEMIYGHHAQTKAELKQLIEAGDWQHLLRRVPVKAGDFLYVPSGTVHAIGKGIMVLETQQSSDTTYRLYDFDRVDKKTGQKRELHLQQSIDVINVPHVDPKPNREVKQVAGIEVTTFVDSDFFKVQRWQLAGQAGSLTRDSDEPYTLVSVIAGSGKLTVAGIDYELQKGQHFILPNAVKEWRLEGTLTLIASVPGKKA